MFNQNVKRENPEFPFDRLETFGPAYQDRYHCRVIAHRTPSEQLLGRKGILFLQQALVRSRSLFSGFVDSVNSTQVVLAYLATRAHFEVTASVAYLLWNLRKHYRGEMKRDELEGIVSRLALGSRTPMVQGAIPERTEAINVLTMIDKADQLFKAVGSDGEKIFRTCYDWLSEFCHPNMLGFIVGSDVAPKGTLVLYERPRFRKADFGTLVHHMLISCHSFFHVCDHCFSLLKKNEAIPELVKPKTGESDTTNKGV